MADEQKPQTINEEAGLPDNWVPIDAPPLIPSLVVPTADGSSKYLQGSLPPKFQHDTSFTGTAYRQDRTPQLSIMPLGNQGDPSTNAGSQSTSSKTLNQALPGVISPTGLVFPATLDNVGDSATFGRVSQTALTTNLINPTKSGVISKGNTPWSATPGFSYTATTTSITWSWTGLVIYRSDGTFTNIPDGTQLISGLIANTTYYFYPYWDEFLLALFWVATGVGTPAYAYTVSTGPLPLQAQNLQSRIPLSTGPMSAVTPASGTGGGTGGGGGGGGGGKGIV